MTGSYNICYSVLFSSQSSSKIKKWIVRGVRDRYDEIKRLSIVSRIALMFADSSQKRLQFPFHEFTGTPFNSPVGFAFMLIYYIDGHTLSDIDFLSLPESR